MKAAATVACTTGIGGVHIIVMGLADPDPNERGYTVAAE
jgi:hypothetical protein